MVTPYHDRTQNDIVYRFFPKTTDALDLEWHTDQYDRTITIENDNDWMFQFDDELPIPLKREMELFIESGRIHRIIKGTSDLHIQIIEWKNND